MTPILIKAAEIVITATATALAAAITRYLEKRKLRKEGKLND